MITAVRMVSSRVKPMAEYSQKITFRSGVRINGQSRRRIELDAFLWRSSCLHKSIDAGGIVELLGKECLGLGINALLLQATDDPLLFSRI